MMKSKVFLAMIGLIPIVGLCYMGFGLAAGWGLRPEIKVSGYEIDISFAAQTLDEYEWRVFVVMDKSQHDESVEKLYPGPKEEEGYALLSEGKCEYPNPRDEIDLCAFHQSEGRFRVTRPVISVRVIQVVNVFRSPMQIRTVRWDAESS